MARAWAAAGVGLLLLARTAAATPTCTLVGSWKQDGSGDSNGEVAPNQTLSVDITVNESGLVGSANQDDIVNAAVMAVSRIWTAPATIDRANGIVVGPQYMGAGLVYRCDATEMTYYRRYKPQVIGAGSTAHVSLQCEQAIGLKGYPEDPWRPCADPGVGYLVGARDIRLQEMLSKGVVLAAQLAVMQREAAKAPAPMPRKKRSR